MASGKKRFSELGSHKQPVSNNLAAVDVEEEEEIHYVHTASKGL